MISKNVYKVLCESQDRQDWKELQGSDQSAVEYLYNNYNLPFDSIEDLKSAVRNSCSEIGYANEDLINNGYWFEDDDVDPEPDFQRVYNYVLNNKNRPAVKDNFELKEDVSTDGAKRVDITIDKVILLWAEGNQAHLERMLGAAPEDLTLSFDKFQSFVFTYDLETSQNDSGYNKVKFHLFMTINVEYNNGETKTYKEDIVGRVDCGDGQEYVDIVKDLKNSFKSKYNCEVNVNYNNSGETINEDSDYNGREEYVIGVLEDIDSTPKTILHEIRNYISQDEYNNLINKMYETYKEKLGDE